jgi:hypothetical protein
MRTSPACGGATVTVRTSRGWLAAHAMAALHSMSLPAVDMVHTVGGWVSRCSVVHKWQWTPALRTRPDPVESIQCSMQQRGLGHAVLLLLALTSHHAHANQELEALKLKVLEVQAKLESSAEGYASK